MGRPVGADRPGAVPGDQGLQPAGQLVERAFPVRVGETGGIVVHGGEGPALGAGVPLGHGVVGVAGHPHDAVAVDVDDDAAHGVAQTAEAADRPRPGRGHALASSSRRANFCVLPDAVFGRASLTSRSSGQYGLAIPRPSRWPRRSSSVGASLPAETMTAQTFSPSRSSGTATTATSWTSGWAMSPDSTSVTGMFSPPRMIRSLLRPVMRIDRPVLEPVALRRARSPVSNHPASTPSGKPAP